MARTKGALNKRTRMALDAASKGKLAEGANRTLSYLQRIVDDPSKPEDVRMKAADILLPYQKPKLSAVEQTNIDPRDAADPSTLLQQLQALIAEKPHLLELLRQGTNSEKSLEISGSISTALQ